jgi:hypothetical protein
MAFDHSGDLLVAELKAAAPDDILKFSTNGSQTVFASGIGQPQGNAGPEFLLFRGGPALITSCFTPGGEPRQHYACVRAMRVVMAKF